MHGRAGGTGYRKTVLTKAAKVDSLHVVNPDGSTSLESLHREMDAGAFGAGLLPPLRGLMTCTMAGVIGGSGKR
jgi:hypothetical protein